MYTVPCEKRVYAHYRGRLSDTENSNLLIYFPHGFGDWVHFSYVVPLLEPSNNYYITRFGDDTVCLMDGCKFLTPLYLGTSSPRCSDGATFSNLHFGIDRLNICGGKLTLNLPLSLHDACERNSIETVIFGSFPETWGGKSFPFHTKARGLLDYVFPNELLASADLTRPLQSAIIFTVPELIQQWMESRLINFLGVGPRKLCLVIRVGYTAKNKNWGYLWRNECDAPPLPEGEECREFMRLMLRKDPKWAFLSMEDRLFEGNATLSSDELHCASYGELFGTPGHSAFPFGILAKALMNVADLSVGVPAGPHHLAMVKPGLPCIGIWIDHFPSWYDEPKEESIHIISKNVVEKGYMDRPGSFTEMGGLKYDCRFVDTRRITGEQAMEAVEELVY